MLLRTWVGKGANMRGYLYAPATPLKLGTDYILSTDDAGIVLSVDCTIETDLGGFWYFVRRDYD